MHSLFAILGGLCSLGSFICMIIIVIRLFQEKGALHGILGIICGLYTFIWGWIHADRLGKKNVMIAWTVLILGAIVFNVMAGAGAAAAGQVQ